MGYFFEEPKNVGGGDYDLDVSIYYIAKSVTTLTSGYVVINLSWPGRSILVKKGERILVLWGDE